MMGHELQTGRRENGEEPWLSMLVDAMEEVSRPELRALPCHPSILMALRAQLARPASPNPVGGSCFSLRKPAPGRFSKT
jgi:hypothetical protein